MNQQGGLSQFRRDIVALISLTIAISSLGYNTWRNEHSEDHRRYVPELVIDSNARSGWIYVLTIKNMVKVLPSPMEEHAENYLWFGAIIDKIHSLVIAQRKYFG